MKEEIRPRLQIIRGLPGSGKSTLAAERYPHLLRLETDMVYETGNAYRFSDKRSVAASVWLGDVVEATVRAQMDFVCSSVYDKFGGRLSMVLDKALNAGYEVWIHSMPIDQNFGNVHDVPDEVYESMKLSFDSQESVLLGIERTFGEELARRVHIGLMPIPIVTREQGEMASALCEFEEIAKKVEFAHSHIGRINEWAIVRKRGDAVHLEKAFNGDNDYYTIESYDNCGWWARIRKLSYETFWDVWSEWNGHVAGCITLEDHDWPEEVFENEPPAWAEMLAEVDEIDLEGLATAKDGVYKVKV